MQRDPEKKITEFDYEEFLHPELLKTVDTGSDSFKKFVRLANLNTKTQYELHLANQDKFKQLMPLLAGLSEEEQRCLVHKIQNDERNPLVKGVNHESVFANAASKENEKNLAKLSE